MHSLTGWLVARHDLHSARLGQRPTAVRMVPTGEWQLSDGVVCVTGHESGAVHLWRLKPAAAHTLLSIAFTLPALHRSPISALRIVSASAPSYSDTVSGAVNLLGRGRGLVQRCSSPAGTFELLVGDSDGLASRWQAPRLESLLPLQEGRRDKRGVARDKDSGSGAVGAPAGDILRFL